MPGNRSFSVRLGSGLRTFAREFRSFGLSIAVRDSILRVIREIVVCNVAIVYAAPTRRGATSDQGAEPDCRKTKRHRLLCLVSSGSFEIPQRQKVVLPSTGVYVSCAYTISKFRRRAVFANALQASASRVERDGFGTV